MLAPAFLFSPKVPSLTFVLDVDKLLQNLAILDRVQKATGAKILLALKAFACWKLFPKMSKAFQGCLFGTCASSVHEARLGLEEFGGEVHAFAAAFAEDEILELLGLCDHLTFNSVAQFRRFQPLIALEAKKRNLKLSLGLRVNPEHSEGAPDIYNPCHPNSRLGVRSSHFDPSLFNLGLSGIHFHTLCEQGAWPLSRTLEALKNKFDPFLKKCAWINFGGGHHITREDYDLELLINLILDFQKLYGATIYLEPGEACALNAGFLTATVLDIVEAQDLIAILDVSPTCHMPDTLEMPYDPPVFYEHNFQVFKASINKEEAPFKYRLAGKSCLAGDVLKGLYGFKKPLDVGTRLIFGDMAIYSMVKTTTFNGLKLPDIGFYQKEEFSLIKSFGYQDFKNRLS